MRDGSSNRVGQASWCLNRLVLLKEPEAAASCCVGMLMQRKVDRCV